MTFSSRKNPLVPIDTSADTGASPVREQSSLFVDFGDPRSDEAGPEHDGFAIDGSQPELVGSTLGRKFYFSGVTVR